MLYELHLTTTPDADRGLWITVSQMLGVKPLVIDLEDGDPRNPRQMMMAAVTEGTDAQAAHWSKGLREGYEKFGFQIVREKLEVPLDKSSPYKTPPYFEAHVKSLIPKKLVDTVVSAATTRGWASSKNSLYPQHDGMEKWYFTQRAYDTDYLTAGTDFSYEFGLLAKDNFAMVRMEMETVIKDSNPELDDGWA